MPQTADPIAQGEDVNTWLRGMTESLTPKTCELLLFLIIILILRRLLTHDSSQNNNHEELVKITSSLSYAFTAQLHLSDKHITHLQEELTRAQSRIDKLEVKVQDQLKAPNEREQETMEQVKKLQAALGAAQCDQQQANAAQKDLRGSTGNLTGCTKPIKQLVQEQLVWVNNDKPHLSTTQTSTVLSIHKNNTAYYQKTWNKS
ncbi:coiled-coil domain-containing protein 102B-like [Labeo rohita]|uniref:Coiled-coil domain-containing protein 102B-like n=1 Tax=Labeo rohita TaxID=84645 RepID=A0A498NY47_LABRO|nr:coiled-coil domain-containing protein 102B-like [Labeo rohita]